jgi:hypothetical protein
VKYYEPIKMYSATQITSEDIQKFVNDFVKDHSPKTTRNVYGLLSSALRTFYPNKAISVRLPQKKPI